MSWLTDAVRAHFAFKPWSSSQATLSSGSISPYSWKTSPCSSPECLRWYRHWMSRMVGHPQTGKISACLWAEVLARWRLWQLMIGFLMVWQWRWHEGVDIWHVVKVADPIHHWSHFSGMFLHSIQRCGCWTSLGAAIVSSGKHTLVSGTWTHVQW